jgi:biotin-(acetyl-CoA carboxylase) ligase
MGEMLDKYRHRCVIIGKKITVIPHSGEKYEAEALGVLDDGSLLVKRLCDGEEIRVFGGEVSTRLSEGKNES